MVFSYVIMRMTVFVQKGILIKHVLIIASVDCYGGFEKCISKLSAGYGDNVDFGIELHA